MKPGRPRFLALIVIAVAALLAAGCGDDDNGSATTDTATTQTQATQPTTTTEEPPAPKAEKVKPTAGEADIDRKPKVPKGKGDPPSGLEVQDLIVGKGTKAKSGDTVSVQVRRRRCSRTGRSSTPPGRAARARPSSSRSAAVR